MISIWEKESFFAHQDVVIAGGGLAGLWSAFYLKKKNPSLKITIADRGIIPTGASTRNAGFACFGSLGEMMHDIKTMGLDDTLSLVEKRHKGLACITKQLHKKEIDFKHCGGYELFGDNDSYTKEELLNSIGYLNTLLKDITGNKKTYRLADEDIKTFGLGSTTHLVYNAEEGYLHSGKLVQQLMQIVASLGVTILPATEITSFVADGDVIYMNTNNSFSLQANKLLICTNAFASELLPAEDVIPARGQVVVTSPIKQLTLKGAFHAKEGFYYFRNLGNRVLLGGARNTAFNEERTTVMQTSKNIQAALERYLSEVVLPHYKNLYTIEYKWAGIMGMGAEKKPIIKEISPGVYCAVRMSGMGVALAPVAAQEVSALMY